MSAPLAVLIVACLLVAQVFGQQPAPVRCNAFDSSCPRGHVCDKGSGYCKSPPNRNVACNAFDGSCPKGLVCDKSKHCVKSPCGGTCDVCLFKGKCVRKNQGHPVSQGMCEHYKGTWCSGPSPPPPPPPPGSCTDSPTWTEATHRGWNCATYAPGKINGIALKDAPAKNKPCADKNAAGVPAAKACPLSCGTCPPDCNIQRWVKHISEECCNGLGERCSGGKPQTCNMGCSKVFMAVWVECKKQLENHFGRQLVSVFGPLHKMCDATAKACKSNSSCKNSGACFAAIPNDYHGGHRRQLQTASSFVCVCKGKGYNPKTHCETCLDTSFDPQRECRACKDSLYDPQAKCKKCRNARYDFKTQCRTCRDPKYDPHKSCTTKFVGCREPEDPLHGDYVSNPFAARTDAGLLVVGTTMPMHCDSGYTPSVAHPSITCANNNGRGQWVGSGTNTHCLDSSSSSSSTPTTATGCLQPLAVTNGENDGSHVGGWSKAPGGQYKTGMTVMLQCKAGYVPSADSSGSTSMLCQNTGLWDFTGSYAVCVQGVDTSNQNIGCTEPQDPPNGDWVTNPFATKTRTGLLAVGTIMPFECNTGFTSTVQSASMTCDNVMGTAQWVGTGLDAACVSGAAPPPPQHSACLAPIRVDHGVWSKPSKSAEYSIRTTTLLTCDQGYQPSSVSSASMTCGLNALWNFDGDYATCVQSGSPNGNSGGDSSCLAPNPDRHGKWSTPPFGASTYTQGIATTLTCNQGYTPTPVQSSEMICGNGGLWSFSGSYSQCAQGQGPPPPNTGGPSTNCLDPVAVEHGSWSKPPFGSYANGMRAILTCDSGYKPKDLSDATMTCQSTGLWGYHGLYAQCISGGGQQSTAGCQEPIDPTHGDWVTNPFAAKTPNGLLAVGTIMPIHCDIGYAPSITDASITCDNVMGNAVWAGAGKRASCLDAGPPPPPNGATSCLPPLAVTNGVWSKPLHNTYDIGVTVILTCNHGFKTKDTYKMMCDNGGRWSFSGTYGSCVVGSDNTASIGCHEPQDPANGDWVTNPFAPKTAQGQLSVGTMMPLECKTGFVLSVSPAQMTCDNVLGNGQWVGNGLDAKCLAKNQAPPPPSPGGGTPCLNPISVDHGAWSKAPFGSFNQGMTTILTCETGYKPVDDASARMVCGSGGIWTFPGDYASCAHTGSHKDADKGCAEPQDPANGDWVTNPFASKTSQGKLKIGTIMPIKCNNGFSPTVADASITCDVVLGNAQWVGFREAQCLQNQGNNPPPPPADSCLSPTPVLNGKWSKAPFGSFTQGMTIILTCDSGFKPTDDKAAHMVCGTGALWQFPGNYASCVQGQTNTLSVGCQEPSDPTNGDWVTNPFATKTQDGRLAVGTIMPIKCNNGFTPSVADASITCDNVMGGGKWVGTGLQAQCLRNSQPSVPPPPPPSNCLAPVSGPHGTWSAARSGGAFSIGATTTLQCAQGYIPSNSQATRMTCAQGGLWIFTGNYAQCTSSSGGNAPSPPSTTCNAPQSVFDGTWSKAPFGSFTPGMTAILTCATGYKAVPDMSANMVCSNQGQWIIEGNGKFASCTQTGGNAPPPPPEVGCTAPTNPPNGEWMVSMSASKTPNGLYVVGTIVPLRCGGGTTSTIKGASISCDNILGGGKWIGTGLNANCQQGGGQQGGNPPPPPASQTCQTPTPVNNGVWSKAPFGSFTEGMTGVLTCNTGMIPSPDNSANIKCTGGKWYTSGGGPYAQCVNGQSQSGTHDGVGCAMPNSIVNGQWQISPFADKLPSGKLAVGTIMPLQCSQGFTSSVRNPSVTCDNVMGNGQWIGPGLQARCLSGGGNTPPPPTTSTGCAKPQNPQNGQWSAPQFNAGSFQAGSTTVLQCSLGYTPNPLSSATMACGQNGQWAYSGSSMAQCSGGKQTPTPPPPTPSGICQNPKSVQYGDWSKAPFGAFSTGMTVVMTCNQGYIPKPDAAANMICGANGQWGYAQGASLQFVSCTQGQSKEGTHTGVSCPAPRPPPNGQWSFSPFVTKIGNNYGINAIGALRCTVGQPTISSASITCDNVMGNGQWVGNGIEARCQ